MYNREQMKEALGKLSWKKVSELIEAVGFSNPEVFDRLIQDVVRTGCLIRKHATPEQRKARDKFRARLRALIADMRRSRHSVAIQQSGHPGLRKR
jgi:hypothetical protein